MFEAWLERGADTLDAPGQAVRVSTLSGGHAVENGIRRRFRLHPQAAYVRDIGYVFIDLGGRMFRMAESEFHTFRTRCVEGLDPGQIQAFSDLLIECASANEANDSFQRQEIPPHEN